MSRDKLMELAEAFEIRAIERESGDLSAARCLNIAAALRARSQNTPDSQRGEMGDA